MTENGRYHDKIEQVIYYDYVLCIYYCRYVQIGIVSKGIECGHPDYPGVYTRVTEVLNWIQSIAVQSLDSNCVAPRQGWNNCQIKISKC